MTPADIHSHFELQRQASREHVDVPLLVRRERLLRMRKLLDENGPVLAAAVQADFGMRSPRLTEVADFLVLRTLLSHTLKHLARWSKPQRVRTPLHLQPAQGYIHRQPLGVVGVISPWNYPVQLALAPAITALAAGNRVMLTPSELTPHTSAQLRCLRRCPLTTWCSPAPPLWAARWRRLRPSTSRPPRLSWAASRPASSTATATCRMRR